jgi:hypothetical protein
LILKIHKHHENKKTTKGEKQPEKLVEFEDLAADRDGERWEDRFHDMANADPDECEIIESSCEVWIGDRRGRLRKIISYIGSTSRAQTTQDFKEEEGLSQQCMGGQTLPTSTAEVRVTRHTLPVSSI